MECKRAPEYLRLTDTKEFLSAKQRQPEFMTNEQQAVAREAAAKAWEAAPVPDEPTVVNSEVELRDALASHAHRWIHIASAIVLSEKEELTGKGNDGTVRPLRVDHEHQDLRLTASEGVTIDASGCKDNRAAFGCALDVRGGCVTLENLTLCNYGVSMWDGATVKAANVAVHCSSADMFAFAWNALNSSLQLRGGRATGSVDTLVYAGSDSTRTTLNDVTIQGTGRYAVHTCAGTIELAGCTIQGCWESALYEEGEATITTTDCTILVEPPPKPEGGGEGVSGGVGSAKKAKQKKKSAGGASGRKAKKGGNKL